MDQYYRQYRYLSAEQREDIASAVSLSPTQVPTHTGEIPYLSLFKTEFSVVI